MAEAINPISEKVKRMAAILEAARKAGKEAKEEQAKEGQGETGQSSPQA